MAIKEVIPKSKAEQLAAFSKLAELPDATQGVAVADAADAADVLPKFNALLASLRGAGIIA